MKIKMVPVQGKIEKCQLEAGRGVVWAEPIIIMLFRTVHRNKIDRVFVAFHICLQTWVGFVDVASM